MKRIRWLGVNQQRGEPMGNDDWSGEDASFLQATKAKGPHIEAGERKDLGLEPVLEWWIFAWLIYTSYNYKL